MLENNLKDLLNAGIGLFKLGEENIQKIISNIQHDFSELKERGEGDNSEMATRLREILNRKLSDARSVSDQAERNLNKFLEEAKNNSSRVLQKFRSFVGEENISDFGARMDGIAKNIQNLPANGHDSSGKGQNSSESDHPAV